MNNLIFGINPITISSITAVKFHRYGPHPSWSKIMCRKNPIRGFLGLYDQGLFHGFTMPYVCIRGANGKDIKHIECKSNDHAIALRDELNTELNKFLDMLVVKGNRK